MQLGVLIRCNRINDETNGPSLSSKLAVKQKEKADGDFILLLFFIFVLYS